MGYQWTVRGIGLRSQLTSPTESLGGCGGASGRLRGHGLAGSLGEPGTDVGVTLRGGMKDARQQFEAGKPPGSEKPFNAVHSRSDLERVADQVALLRKRYLQTGTARGFLRCSGACSRQS